MIKLLKLLILCLTFTKLHGCGIHNNDAICFMDTWDEAYHSLHSYQGMNIPHYQFQFMLNTKTSKNFTLPAGKQATVLMSNVPLSVLEDLLKMRFLKIEDSTIQCWTNQTSLINTNIEYLFIQSSLNCIPCPDFYFKNLRFLILTKNNLTTIPQIISPHLSFLSLAHNNLTYVQNLDLLTRLTFLDLSYNPIAFLPNHAFNDNPLLTSLYLSYTSVNNLFFETPLLNDLIVNNCKLKQLYKFFFIGLPDLKVLDVSNNQIQSISDQLSELTLLYHLDLSHNPMMSLADHVFNNLVSLEVLRLSSIGLSQMPLQTKILPTLHSLDISYNHFETLNGDFFTKTPNLASLKVNNNYLISFNAAEKLGSLRVLDLSYNFLQLREEYPLEGMPNLEDLKMTNNKLKGDVERIIFSFPALQELNVDNNSFTEIGNKENHHNLKVLKIRNNSLTCGEKLKEDFDQLFNEDHVFFDYQLYTSASNYSYTWACSDKSEDVLLYPITAEDDFVKFKYEDNDSQYSYDLDHYIDESPENDMTAAVHKEDTKKEKLELSFTPVVVAIVIVLLITLLLLAGYKYYKKLNRNAIPSPSQSRINRGNEPEPEQQNNNPTNEEPTPSTSANLGNSLTNNPITNAFKPRHLQNAFHRLRVKFGTNYDGLENELIRGESSNSIA